MKFLTIATAALASLTSISADAATIIVQVDAFATGTIKTYAAAGNTLSTELYSQSFSFQTDASDLTIGTTKSFSIGPNANAGVITGLIARSGGTETNQLFFGANFAFNQTSLLSTGFRETSLKASSFSVRQIIPAPVPEPATWAMMMLGFGAVGYSMRRRSKASVRFA